jgi:hypothetical protein
MRRGELCFLVLLLALFLVSGCGGSRDDAGALSVGLTDAASSDYQAVYVTIKEVQVHMGGSENGNWQVVASPDKTYNLLELVNGMIEQLGVSSLETGSYSQMRLIIGHEAEEETNVLGQRHPYANYLIDSSSGYHQLRIPSGFQTGIKLVRDFEIVDGLTTELILDFDVERSVVRAGESGNWLLKPTIKVVDTVENATVSGVVVGQSAELIAGAKVSAQVYDRNTNQVSVDTSTLSDEAGEYLMYLEPGAYTIVAYLDGYSPVCSELSTAHNEDYEASFALTPVDMGVIACNVVLPQSVQGAIATVRFIRISPCDPMKLIEFKSINVSESGSYNVTLPAGTYSVLASDGTTALPVQNIATGGTATLDFRAD